MTKEQEEIIKEIKIYIHDYIMESFDDDGYTRYEISEEEQEFFNNIETALNMLKENSAEIKQKDRQINYMANFINDNMPYTKDTKELENEEGIRTANFTTKYFERKSKE